MNGLTIPEVQKLPGWYLDSHFGQSQDKCHWTKLGVWV